MAFVSSNLRTSTVSPIQCSAAEISTATERHKKHKVVTQLPFVDFVPFGGSYLLLALFRR
jgi:hypothetical protein